MGKKENWSNTWPFNVRLIATDTSNGSEILCWRLNRILTMLQCTLAMEFRSFNSALQSGKIRFNRINKIQEKRSNLKFLDLNSENDLACAWVMKTYNKKYSCTWCSSSTILYPMQHCGWFELFRRTREHRFAYVCSQRYWGRHPCRSSIVHFMSMGNPHKWSHVVHQPYLHVDVKLLIWRPPSQVVKKELCNTAFLLE